ncbi:MAG: dihydrofolate reductase family protein [Holophagae bacterium]|jgi:dihydrofolate reductase
MLTVIYSVACSVDGFIADADGGIDWLSRIAIEGEDFGHGEFFGSVDAMVMGSTTYEQVLGFGEWPYGETPCWVLSSQRLPAASKGVTVTPFDPAAVLSAIEAQGMQRVWLVGGGQLAGAFRDLQLIDECVVTVIPVILGNGVPLFAGDGPSSWLQLISSREMAGGVISLHYERAADS